jgi:replicative DNA helicase
MMTMFDTEKALVGAILGKPSTIDLVTVTGRDFADPQLGDVFDQIRAFTESGKTADFITVSAALPQHSQLLASLSEYVFGSYAVEEYAGIVAEASLRRRLKSAGIGLANLEDALTPSEMVERARQLVDDAVGQSASKVRFIRDILPSLEKKLEMREMFIPSPWRGLNAVMGGFRPGAVYVVAARPGVGKTVIAAQIATEMAKHGLVSFSSLEMTETELVSRIIAERLDISVGHLNDGKLNAAEKQVLADHRDVVASLSIAVDDRSGVNPSDIRQFVRTVSRNGKLSGVVVDYLQLLTSKSKMERHNQVAEFSRQLKIMANDFRVPVIALSQLNRNVEGRAEQTPRLSDLRESGAIEQDADVVILLRREGFAPTEELVMDVAKNRHGETGEVRLYWDGRYSRAVNQ